MDCRHMNLLRFIIFMPLWYAMYLCLRLSGWMSRIFHIGYFVDDKR